VLSVKVEDKKRPRKFSIQVSWNGNSFNRWRFLWFTFSKLEGSSAVCMVSSELDSTACPNFCFVLNLRIIFLPVNPLPLSSSYGMRPSHSKKGVGICIKSIHWWHMAFLTEITVISALVGAHIQRGNFFVFDECIFECIFLMTEYFLINFHGHAW
jgi:hypothetical protein